MKFKTLNMQKDKILGASACSLLKTFWIFLHANVYVCLFPFLYTKLCPLKWKFSHSSQVLKIVKISDRAGNTFFDYMDCFITYTLNFYMEIEENKKNPIFSFVSYILTKKSLKKY